MARIDRRVLGFAALISVPPGIGLWLATLRVTGGLDQELAIVAGVTMTAALFVIVLALAGTGRREPLE